MLRLLTRLGVGASDGDGEQVVSTGSLSTNRLGSQPADVVEVLCRYLDMRDIVALARTSKHLHRYVGSPSLPRPATVCRVCRVTFGRARVALWSALTRKRNKASLQLSLKSLAVFRCGGAMTQGGVIAPRVGGPAAARLQSRGTAAGWVAVLDACLPACMLIPKTGLRTSCRWSHHIRPMNPEHFERQAVPVAVPRSPFCHSQTVLLSLTSPLNAPAPSPYLHPTAHCRHGGCPVRHRAPAALGVQAAQPSAAGFPLGRAAHLRDR